MHKLEIKLCSENRTFVPGEQLKGEVTWNLPENTDGVELRLFWATAGRGIPETGLADTLCFDHPPVQDTRQFAFQLPKFPFTYEGRLMRLTWAVEAICGHGNLNAHEEFVLAPERKAVALFQSSSVGAIAVKAAA